MAELEVQIGADVKDLLKKLDLTEKQLKSLEKISTKSGAKIGSIGTQASKGINKLGKSTRNAVPAVTEFSRVIQDAPFGIQGVANNITQLTQNFGYLKTQAGGTVPALKAMLSTLSGPAGILLVVSAVTSLMVSYGDELLNVIKGNNALAASQKAVGKALNDFYGGQISKVNSYVSILEDVNTSEKQRKNITNELIKIIPNLTKEDFKYGNNLDLVKSKIGNYVLAQASRIEADTLVEENSEKLSKKARIEQLKNIDDQEKRIRAFTKFLEDEDISIFDKKIIYSGGITSGITKTTRKSKQDIIKVFNAFADELDIELKPIQDRVNELYGSAFSGGLENNNKPKETRVKIKPIVELVSPQVEQSNFEKFAKGSIDILKENFNISGKLGADLIDLSPAKLEIESFIEAFKPLEDKLTEIPIAANILSNATSSAFSNLSSQLSSSFASGNAVIDGFVSSIINSLAQVAAAGLQSIIIEKTIGKAKNSINQNVSSGNAVTVATSAAAALGPAGVFALPGLIASQLAIVNGTFGSLASFAKGGFSGDDNLAYLNKNELVLRPMEQAALYNAIRGRSFSSIGSNGSTGSDSNDNSMIGTATLRGSNQYIQFKRSQRKMNRFYSS